MPATLDYPTLLLLGLIAGATIFLGLPIGRLPTVNPAIRSGLSMLAAGILLFLLVEILGKANEQTVDALRDGPLLGGVMILALLGGLLVGLVGLVGIEQRLIRRARANSATTLPFMVAAGIGVHNLSEGLAIGQSYVQGHTALSLGLVMGFGLHNATEGFGIVGPSLCGKARLPWRTLLLLGLIAGGPTFLGTLLGSLWTNEVFNVFVLAMAGGAILYVLKEMFASVRQVTQQAALMTALSLGFMLGWGTEAIGEALGGEQGHETVSLGSPAVTRVSRNFRAARSSGLKLEHASCPFSCDLAGAGHRN